MERQGSMSDSGPAATLEEQRLAALARYRVLDTPREQGFNDLAALASMVCGTPIAVVNLIGSGRQWFKAEVGLGVDETPLGTSFCATALLEQDFLIVPDATQDERFACNPLVTGEPGLRFYAGALLKSPDGFPIGTLCVLDYEPRALSDQQQEALRTLARQVMAQLELRLAVFEREESNAELRASEARFRAAVQAVQGVLWTNNAAGKMEGEQPAWVALTGQTAEEYKGYGWSTAVHPDDVQATVAAWNAAVAAKRTFEFEHRVRRHDGEWRHFTVRAIPTFDPDGPILEWVGVHTDITDQRANEAQLRDLNEMLETRGVERAAELSRAQAERDRLWEASPDLMLVIDFAGVFRRVNPAWTSVLGYSPDELVNHHVNEFVLPDDHSATVAAYELAASGGVPRIVNRYRHKDGSIRWISWTAAPEGDLTYATGRDITAEMERQAELSATQEALRQSQKLEALGQLTGGVAHDFNNLLTIIKSSTDLLQLPTITDERRARYIRAISETVDRASTLTSQLLSFARRQSLKPEVFDAAGRVSSIGHMLGTIVGSRIQIVTDLPNEPCLIEADASQFETAIVNLTVNARDAMAGEGRLTIRARRVSHAPAIRSHDAADGDFVYVSVTDTGCGMHADQLTRIFEPFFTTKPVGHGTGLGLSQVYGFSKQSGGNVSVESEPGKGTTFTIYLPRAAVQAIEAGDGSVEQGRQLESPDDRKRILVVEDNVEVGTFSTQLLQDLGYDTDWASNGEEALSILSADPGFDLVFSDVIMPRMTGIELGEEIRIRHPMLPVVLTSGYSHVLAEQGRHGFELLQKPYAIQDLSRVIRAALRQAAGR